MKTLRRYLSVLILVLGCVCGVAQEQQTHKANKYNYYYRWKSTGTIENPTHYSDRTTFDVFSEYRKIYTKAVLKISLYVDYDFDEPDYYYTMDFEIGDGKEEYTHRDTVVVFPDGTIYKYRKKVRTVRYYHPSVRTRKFSAGLVKGYKEYVGDGRTPQGQKHPTNCSYHMHPKDIYGKEYYLSCSNIPFVVCGREVKDGKRYIYFKSENCPLCGSEAWTENEHGRFTNCYITEVKGRDAEKLGYQYGTNDGEIWVEEDFMDVLWTFMVDGDYVKIGGKEFKD